MEGQKAIKLYAISTCPHCQRAKQFLEENGFSFRIMDVGSDKTALDEMVRKTGKSVVPIFDIEGAIIVGFNEADVRQALGL